MDYQNKPLSLVVEEFEIALSDLVNNSGLSIIITEPIVAELHRQMVAVRRNQLESDRTQWNKQSEAVSEGEQNGDDI